MKIEIEIQPVNGVYSCVVTAPSGASCADGVSLEGVLRCVAMAIVDEFNEMIDIHGVDFGDIL